MSNCPAFHPIYLFSYTYIPLPLHQIYNYAIFPAMADLQAQTFSPPKKQMDEKTINLTFRAIEPNPKIFEKNKNLRVVGDDDKLALFTSGLRRKIPPPAS